MSRLQFLIAVVVMSITALSGPAKADDVNVSGVDAIKYAVRRAAQTSGLAGLNNLGPWQVTYTGSANQVRLSMLPANAFTTSAGANGRTFTVALTNPSALLTSQGNLRQMGVQVDVVDNVGGTGQSTCAIFAEFRTTGTNQLINVQAAYNANPNGVQVFVDPLDTIETNISYSGSHINFIRRAGDSRPATVTLRILDSGEWFSYQSPLATCGTVATAPAPAPVAPAPQAPRRRMMDVPYEMNFEVPIRGRADFMRTRYFACDEAKRDAQSDVGDIGTFCGAEATIHQGMPITAQNVVSTGSMSYLSCSCEQDDGCHSCTATGTVTCHVSYTRRELVDL